METLHEFIDAPAKINLFLRVIGLDGEGPYHRIETLFLAVDLRDRLEVEITPGGIELEVEGADLGAPEDNLARRAAASFLDATGWKAGVRLRLIKRIPAGAGLGGGSSDAAATLKALAGLMELSGPALGSRPAPGLTTRLAGELGADVPFFLGRSAFALGRGRGDELTELPPPRPAPVILGLSDVHVSTRWAYQELRRRRGADGPAIGGYAVEARGLDWGALAAMAANDFEDVVVPAHRTVAAAREALERTRPLLTLLSGSGSALFSVYEDPADAARALGRVRGAVPGVRFVPARTLEELPAATVAKGAAGEPGSRPGLRPGRQG